MDTLEKVRFNIISELDVFISLLEEEGVIQDKEVRKFIRDTVISRLTLLRVIVNEGRALDQCRS